MARQRIRSESKATGISISLNPEHKLMLVELEKSHKKSRSYIVQDLIKKAHAKIKERV